ncbi:MAG: 2-aminoadipate transaminase [Pseudohongiellaceae bacterium]|jgi:DNA-binding transcriptional MocR family regulator
MFWEKYHAAFFNRIDNLKPSPTRKILSVIDKPGLIFFAGGLPSLESMPKLELEAMPQQYLQYGERAGELELRDLICADMCAREPCVHCGLSADPPRVAVGH